MSSAYPSKTKNKTTILTTLFLPHEAMATVVDDAIHADEPHARVAEMLHQLFRVV